MRGGLGGLGWGGVEGKYKAKRGGREGMGGGGKDKAKKGGWGGWGDGWGRSSRPDPIANQCFLKFSTFS